MPFTPSWPSVQVALRNPLGQLVDGRLLGGRLVDQLIFHVGDVDDPRDGEALEDQVSLDGIKDDGADGVPDVARLVYRSGRTGKCPPCPGAR